MEMKIEGLKEVNRALKELPNVAAGRALRSALTSSTLPLKKEMKKNAPRRSEPGAKVISGKKSTGGNAKGGFVKVRWPGNLAKSIITRLIDKGPHHVTLGVGPASHGFYGLFAEKGTSHQPAKPWMRPALDSQGQNVINRFAERIWQTIEREAAKLKRT